MTEEQQGDVAIRTPDQRLRVFVSSTLAELADERAAVARAISALRLTPVLFELGARPHPPRELYRAYLAQSDIFIGLYWQRYGWIGPGMDISGLEDEFRLSALDPPAAVRQDTGARPGTSADGHDRRAPDGGDRLLPHVPHPAGARATGPRRPRPAAERAVRGRRQPRRPFGAARVDHRPAGPALPAGDVDVVDRARAGHRRGLEAARRRPRSGWSPSPVPAASARRGWRSPWASNSTIATRRGRCSCRSRRSLEPELVLPRIAAAVGATIEGARPPLDVLVEHFAETPTLLVLDNLEQVVGVAPELDQLLARCPGLEILATSRTVLRLRAEREYPVGPLTVPAFSERPPIEQLALAARRAAVRRSSPGRPLRLRPDRRQRAGRRRRSAGASMVCRSPSSSRRPAPDCWNQVRCSLGSEVASTRWVPARSIFPSANARCARPSSGASGCSTTPSSTCWPPCRSSSTDGRSRRPCTSPASPRTGRSTCSMPSPGTAS